MVSLRLLPRNPESAKVRGGPPTDHQRQLGRRKQLAAAQQSLPRPRAGGSSQSFLPLFNLLLNFSAFSLKTLTKGFKKFFAESVRVSVSGWTRNYLKEWKILVE